MTQIKTKVSIHWQTFKGIILIHCSVGTEAVCKEFLLKEGALSRKSSKHKFAVKFVNFFYVNFLKYVSVLNSFIVF